MKKLTSLNLIKDKTQKFMYYALPIWEGTRKDNSIDGFTDDNSVFFFTEYENVPTVLSMDKKTSECTRMIDFHKRVNHQLFGQNYENGKCVFGFQSQPWHKKNNLAELTLFESDVDFEELYKFDFHEGAFVPEFSTKQNWIQAYLAAYPQNLRKSLEYAQSQPKPPELLMMLDYFREQGLMAD